MVIAENLAAHALAGIYCNFSTLSTGFVGSATLPEQSYKKAKKLPHSV